MRVRGDSLGSSRLETRLPHLDAGGTRSFRDIRETPRRDRACPHRASPDCGWGHLKGFEASLDFTPVKRFRKQALLGASRNALSHLIGQSFVR